ncbi:MAG: hypothetical protein GKR88_17725 [Flavobacteriaceae bacterium]|nr:MAG: hypothetical protein GKR88_17725 [Flavobacteriaceae bacterium]
MIYSFTYSGGTFQIYVPIGGNVPMGTRKIMLPTDTIAINNRINRSFLAAIDDTLFILS